MSNVKKRPEVLSPAGTLEKLKVAIDYGADAVFVGGQAYGLRSRAGNFSMEELQHMVDIKELNDDQIACFIKVCNYLTNTK